jgi:hypothetical protein
MQVAAVVVALQVLLQQPAVAAEVAQALQTLLVLLEHKTQAVVEAAPVVAAIQED